MSDVQLTLDDVLYIEQNEGLCEETEVSDDQKTD
jgi:hypothetical protein